jgi:hypothetical protein
MDEKTRKHLAQLSDELLKLPPGVGAELYNRVSRNTYSAHLPAHHHSRSLFGSSCAKTDLLLLSGRHATGNNGKATIRIDDLLCGAVTENVSPLSLVMLREPNVVVTPLGATPAFATVQTASTPRTLQSAEIVMDRAGNLIHRDPIQDVTIDVLTWKPDGSAAANTVFSWICTIEAGRLTNIGG